MSVMAVQFSTTYAATTAASALVVHKFGGSSLASAERFHAVADILLSQPQDSAWVVVSAPGDTTDALLALLAVAADQTELEQHWQHHRIIERKNVCK